MKWYQIRIKTIHIPDMGICACLILQACQYLYLNGNSMAYTIILSVSMLHHLLRCLSKVGLKEMSWKIRIRVTSYISGGMVCPSAVGNCRAALYSDFPAFDTDFPSPVPNWRRVCSAGSDRYVTFSIHYREQPCLIDLGTLVQYALCGGRRSRMAGSNVSNIKRTLR